MSTTAPLAAAAAAAGAAGVATARTTLVADVSTTIARRATTVAGWLPDVGSPEVSGSPALTTSTSWPVVRRNPPSVTGTATPLVPGGSAPAPRAVTWALETTSPLARASTAIADGGRSTSAPAGSAATGS